LTAVTVRARPQGLPLGAILLVGGLVAGTAVHLFGLDHLPFPACLFKAVTGWPCLTCGSTRAVGRLFAGDLPGALAMNPLTTVVALGIVPWGLVDLALAARRRALDLSLSGPASLAARGTAVALLLANWAYLIAVRR
jgi:hypothetical protein